MAETKIEWTDFTWTPLRARVKEDAPEIARAKGYTSLVQIAEKMRGRVGPHCERISAGCGDSTGGGCYSETNNSRCLPYNGTGLPFDRRSRDMIDPIVDDGILKQPLHWKHPRKVFVCSQTDLFGEWVSDEDIDRVFAIMALCPQHTFQVLTKRAERMRRYLNTHHAHGLGRFDEVRKWCHLMSSTIKTEVDWPLPNVWLGVSVENQATKHRIDDLRETPAAVRFLSLEPLLEDLGELDLRGIHWVIAGSESGPGAREAEEAWFRSIKDQCVAARVPFFLKQYAQNGKKVPLPLLDGRTWDEFPEVRR